MRLTPRGPRPGQVFGPEARPAQRDQARPRFVPAEGGSQARQELRERLDEAWQRAREACSSIEPPR